MASRKHVFLSRYYRQRVIVKFEMDQSPSWPKSNYIALPNEKVNTDLPNGVFYIIKAFMYHSNLRIARTHPYV